MSLNDYIRDHNPLISRGSIAYLHKLEKRPTLKIDNKLGFSGQV